MKKLLMLWLIFFNTAGYGQQVTRRGDTIDFGTIKLPYGSWDKCPGTTKSFEVIYRSGSDTPIIRELLPDTLRATLLVAYTGRTRSVAWTMPGFVIMGMRANEYLDDMKRQVKPQLDVWGYKIKK